MTVVFLFDLHKYTNDKMKPSKIKMFCAPIYIFNHKKKDNIIYITVSDEISFYCPMVKRQPVDWKFLIAMFQDNQNKVICKS